MLAAKSDNARFIPLGIAYIASYCKRDGHVFRIYDEIPGLSKSLEQTLKSFVPDIVGISCMTATYSQACNYAKEIKKISKKIPIVFGGVHPTVCIEETLKNKFVDFVVYGEGEETFSEFLEKYETMTDYSNIKGLAYKRNGKIFINKKRPLIKDINLIPMPDRELFELNYYTQRWNWPRGNWYKTANLMSSRGCPYECTFCGSKSMFGRTFRAFSVQRTVDEIEYLVKHYGFECLSFSDDTFAINQKRSIEICREIKRRGINAKFRFQFRANTCYEDLIAAVRDIGCIHIDIGAESGSNKILKQMKKQITVEEIKESVTRIKRYGIRVGVTFIIGSPDETREDIEKTKELAKELRADYTQFFIMTPYPGTELYQYAKDNDLFPKFHSYDDFRHGGQDLKPFLNTMITPEKLVLLREELNASFANTIAKNYIFQPKFLKDLIRNVINHPGIINKFLRETLRTKSIGSGLKVILPHKL